MTCKHVDSAELRVPTPAQSVYREDCTQCFDSIDDPTGLNVCLYCFNGGCCSDRNHAKIHHESSRHPMVLNIKRKRKRKTREEPPQKISKLAIAAETEEDRYDTTTEVRCYECGIDDVDKGSGKLSAVVDGVLKANTFAKQAEVQAWEQEITACEHTLCLEQEPARQIESQSLGHCSMCDLKENLWLCLQCGNLGCGRQQFGGVGGNSHGLRHTELTNHAVAVKLGSLTPDGTADIYCYACNEERTDPELAAHLGHWGINIAEREKTEKSLTEMQIEQNLKWEFSMTTEDGKELKPVFGEGFTGLKNLGNSCYLASILQCIFSTPAFAARYFHPQEPPPAAPNPAEDLETQLRKVADGLLSGRYSYPDSDVIASEDSPYIPHQKGLAPAMLKHLIGRGHEEFSTMRQQDAFELFLHLLKLVTRSQHTSPAQDPVKAFRFVMEQRLQCISCNRVRYRTDEQDNISIPVPVRRKLRVINGDAPDEKPKDEFEPVTLKECLDTFTGAEEVELTCPGCNSKAGFTKRSLFKTFPDVLAVNARRFELVNWVPTKLDVPVVVDDEPFNLDSYMSSGQQDGEELLPEEANTSAATQFTPNAAAVEQLEGMGFPRVRCEKALHATGNGDAETAMNWLFSHMEDPDIDTPLDLGGSNTAGTSATVNAESLEMMAAMGIGAPQARKALKETGGDVERAVDWVFSHPDDQGEMEEESAPSDVDASGTSGEKAVAGSSDLPAKFRLRSIVCHKGASIHAGHYVAFIRKQIPAEGSESWVLYNDEKVVKAMDVEEMKKFAKGATYLILLQVGSRALTFVVNQILLRFLSPELLGISTQLELYSISVLFFARESLRVALQRQEDPSVTLQSDDGTLDQNASQPKTRSNKAQEVVNLSYLAIALGVPLVFLFASLYIRSADSIVLGTPGIHHSLYVYCLATILELFSEPCFAVAQQQMLYGVRASAETLATFTRCLVTCGTVIWASKVNLAPGALPFALGQMGYAIVLNLTYFFRLDVFSPERPYSLLIQPVVPSSSAMLYDRFSSPRLNLAFTIYAQSVFKHLLTSGDSFLIAAFTSLESQGAYTLAANYGGLVARMVFQPIEETSRSLFGRLLHHPPSPDDHARTETDAVDRRQVNQAATYLRCLLRFYLVTCTMAVAIGPSFSPLLLRVVAGSRWSDSEAPSVLAAYCYYVPFLAVNGILEAFVSAGATPEELRVQSVWMIAFSAAFVGTGFLLLNTWDQGAHGLVVANAINMLCRIAWSWQFVEGHLRRRGAVLDFAAILPSAGTMAYASATALYLTRAELAFGGPLWQLGKGIAAAGSCVLVT
ncbi:MAG: hypothetical protein Q9168_006488 [Polycauliona sp. 1 TL-2023]